MRDLKNIYKNNDLDLIDNTALNLCDENIFGIVSNTKIFGKTEILAFIQNIRKQEKASTSIFLHGISQYPLKYTWGWLLMEDMEKELIMMFTEV